MNPTHYHYSHPGEYPCQVFTPESSSWAWGEPVSVLVLGYQAPGHRGDRSLPLLRTLLTRWVSTLGHTVALDYAISSSPVGSREEKGSSRPTKAILDLWGPRLQSRLAFLRPQLILTQGSKAARMVLGPKLHSLAEDHGTLFRLPDGTRVLPTFEFSQTYLDLDVRRMLTRDLERFESDLAHSDSGSYSAGPLFTLEKGSSGMMPSRDGGPLFLDIETSGLDPAHDRLLSLGLRQGGRTLIIQDPEIPFLSSLASHLRREGIVVAGHNLYFDLYWLTYVSGEDWCRLAAVRDTMLMALVDGEPRLSLKHLTSLYTSLNGSHAFGGPEDPAYLAQDLESTEALFQHYPQEGPFILQKLHAILPHLVRARYDGVRIDVSRLEVIGQELRSELEPLTARLTQHPGISNPSSDVQVRQYLSDEPALSRFLKDKRNSKLHLTPKGQLSVSTDSLQEMLDFLPEGHGLQSFIRDLIDFRSLRKLATGFVDGYQRLADPNGFIHPRLLLHGARTGRLSSADPNIQQVPRVGSMKSLFISRFPGGNLGLIDLSQAELRCAALLSNDRELMASLLTDDPHRHNAARLYQKAPEEVTPGERKKSKAITFGLLYRGTPEGLAARTGFPLSEVKEALSLFSEAFPVLMDWLARVESEGQDTLLVKTLLGRTRELRTVLQSEGPKAVGRKAVNTPIQSLASDINLLIALSVVSSLEERRLRSRFLFLVHDSILLDIHPEETEEVSALVRSAYAHFSDGSPLQGLPLWGQLPIIGELIVGPSWASIESTNEGYGPRASWPCSSALATEERTS